MITYYINLDSAIERKQKFLYTDYQRWKATTKSEVSAYVDKKMLSMYNFGRESHLARCACFLSHTKLLEEIVKKKLNDVLILEDDAKVTENFNPIIEVPVNTDAIYLGASHGNNEYVAADIGNGLARIRNLYATHAIL